VEVVDELRQQSEERRHTGATELLRRRIQQLCVQSNIYHHKIHSEVRNFRCKLATGLAFLTFISTCGFRDIFFRPVNSCTRPVAHTIGPKLSCKHRRREVSRSRFGWLATKKDARTHIIVRPFHSREGFCCHQSYVLMTKNSFWDVREMHFLRGFECANRISRGMSFAVITC
jgi:hypothetical protein